MSRTPGDDGGGAQDTGLIADAISVMDDLDAQATPPESNDPTPPSATSASPASVPETPVPDVPGDVPSPPSPASAPDGAPAATASKTPEEPFVFKADRREIRPEGARVVGETIVFDKAKWPAFQSQFVADRSSWRQQQAAWDQERAELSAQLQQRTPEQEKAAAFAQEIDRLVALDDPKQVAAVVQHWKTHWSTLLLKKENELLREQSSKVQQRHQTESDAAALESLVPEMHDHLAGAFDHYLATDALKVLGSQKDALLAEYLESEGDIRTGGRAYTWNAEQQAYFLDVPRLERWLGREAQRAQANADLVKRHAEAARKNAAATTPTVARPPAPTPVAGRDTQGRFTKSVDPDDAYEQSLMSTKAWFDE